jgi:hypothetical protein
VIRALLIAAAALACAACEGDGSSKTWRESGDVTYDTLKSATEACKAKGGELRLKNGGDPTQLGDYECVQEKGR